MSDKPGNQALTLDEYQTFAARTAIYPDTTLWMAVKDKTFPRPVDMGVLYTAMGLAGEAGEVCNTLKKTLRDSGTPLGLSVDGLKKELGDCLWYISELARQLDLSLSEIAEANLVKLEGRKERGTLGGSGDER